MSKVPTSQVANDLRGARKASGLTQSEVASRWGRSQSQVVRVETSDPDTMHLKTLRSYVAALGGSCRVCIEVGGEVFDLGASGGRGPARDRARR